MSVFGDDEKEKEAKNNYSNPNANVGSNLIQSNLDTAEGGVHVAAVRDDDDVLYWGVVQEGGVAAAETGGARLGEAGAPVHEASP